MLKLPSTISGVKQFQPSFLASFTKMGGQSKPCNAGVMPTSPTHISLFRVGSHKSQDPSRKSNWNMEIGTHHFIWGPKSQLPTLTWMLTCRHFLEVRPGTCVASWVVQKARPSCQPKSRKLLQTTITLFNIFYYIIYLIYFITPDLYII